MQEEEREKDSEGSEGDEQEKKDVMPDATGEMPEVPEETGVRKDLIPGYS